MQVLRRKTYKLVEDSDLRSHQSISHSTKPPQARPPLQGRPPEPQLPQQAIVQAPSLNLNSSTHPAAVAKRWQYLNKIDQICCAMGLSEQKTYQILDAFCRDPEAVSRHFNLRVR